MFRTAAEVAIVNTIVEFHSLIPVVAVGMSIETVIACGFGRIFTISLLLVCLYIESRCEALSRAIIEIV